MEFSGLQMNEAFPHSTVFDYASKVDYQAGAVVSKTIVKKDTGTITLFAFAKGQGLSEHSAPFDAIVQVVDGMGQVTINGQPFVLQWGNTIIMPAGVPHSVQAVDNFKMLLTMIRG